MGKTPDRIGALIVDKVVITARITTLFLIWDNVEWLLDVKPIFSKLISTHVPTIDAHA